MYCRICGNSLKDTDLICDVCGTPVAGRKGAGPEEEIIYNSDKSASGAAVAMSRDEESVAEIGPKGNETLAGSPDEAVSVIWRPDDTDSYAFTKAKKKEELDFKFVPPERTGAADEEFNWNVHEFSKAEHPSEPVEFVWDVEAPKKEEVPDAPITLEEIVKAVPAASPEPESAARESLRAIDKFFTFSQKSAEFQKLLDREYEKLQQMARPEMPEPGPFGEPETGQTARYNKEEFQKELEELMEAAAHQETGAADEPAAMAVDTVQTDSIEGPEEAAAPEEPQEETPAAARLETAAAAQMEPQEAAPEEQPAAAVQPEPAPAAKGSRQAAEMAAARSDYFKDNTAQEASDAGAEEKAPEEAEAPEISPAAAAGPVFFAPDEEDLEDDEDGRRNWGFGKSAAAVIAVIIILELVLLGIKYALPDSEAAAAIGQFQKNVTEAVGGLYAQITGGEEPAEEPGGAEEPGAEEPGAEEPGAEEPGAEEPAVEEPDPMPMADMDALVASQLSANVNIKEVKANSQLRFDAEASYPDPGLAASKPITDNILYAPAEGETGDAVYYDRSIVAAIIAFDSRWIDYVNKGDRSVLEVVKTGSKAYQNVVNFSKAGKVTEKFLLLEIGELRHSGDHYYAWTSERIEIIEGGKAVVKDYRWIYKLEKIDKDLKIVNYYRY